MDTTTIVTAVVAGIPSFFAAVFAYRTSAHANRISETKVDGEAYERSQQFYEKVMAGAERELARLQAQVDRLNDQLERVNNQLALEQDVSNTLRNHLRALQTQVTAMESTVLSLRSGFNRGGGGGRMNKKEGNERT